MLIGDVDPDSPAGKAGLQSGDIVLEYDGEPVTKADDLRMRVAGTKPGDEVELEIWRDGKRKTIDVEIGELENEDVADDAPGRAARLGRGHDRSHAHARDRRSSSVSRVTSRVRW